jgi:hypothetical protein
LGGLDGGGFGRVFGLVGGFPRAAPGSALGATQLARLLAAQRAVAVAVAFHGGGPIASRRVLGAEGGRGREQEDGREQRRDSVRFHSVGVSMPPSRLLVNPGLDASRGAAYTSRA